MDMSEFEAQEAQLPQNRLTRAELFLYNNPEIFSTPVIHRETCYICRDPDFAEMGMPLCSICTYCEGHIAADDTICDDCGGDAYEAYLEEQKGLE